MEHFPRAKSFIKDGRRLASRGLRLGVNHDLRREWMESHFEEGEKMGLLEGDHAKLVRTQAAKPETEAHLRDFALLSAGLTAITLPAAGILAGAGALLHSPEATAAAGVMFGAVPRFTRWGYLGGRMLQDRFNSNIDPQHLPSLRREALVFVTSATPLIGSLAVLPRMAAEAPELAIFLRDYYKHKLATGKMERPVNFLMDNFFQLPHKRVTVHETPYVPFGSMLYRRAAGLAT